MISTGGHLTILESIDSTNNYAMAQVRTGLAKHGDGFFAMAQTQGKGQRGKAWVTEPGTNIILTLAMQPAGLVLQHQFQLSMAIALAVQDFFGNYAGSETTIKWPNDIYWRDRKAGGILIESIVGSGGRRRDSGADSQEPGSRNRELEVDSREPGSTHLESGSKNWEPKAEPTIDFRLPTPDSNWQWAIIGMGININQKTFPESIRHAVSLKQITGKEYDVIAMAEELCGCVQNRYKELLSGTNLLQPYNERLYKRAQQVTFRKGNRVFEGRVKEVNLLGELVVMTAAEEHFGFGEIEWVQEG